MKKFQDNIEAYCNKFNELRLKGGTYTTQELAKALKGIPYYGNIPTIMKRNPNISGYMVSKDGITFDTKHSIYKDAIVMLITEAYKYHAQCSKNSNKTNKKVLFLSTLKQICGEFEETPIIISRVVVDACVKLHNTGKCDLVPKVMKEYNLFLKMC